MDHDQSSHAVLPPEEFVEQLRGLMAQVGSVTPLTGEQRRAIRERIRVSREVVEASINVIGTAESIAQVVGIPAAEVRQMIDEASRWTAAESELRTALNGIAGANLIRRQRIALVTAQAYHIGRQLARDPANAGLLPQIEEVKRLRKISHRRGRGPQAPDPPAAPDNETPKE